MIHLRQQNDFICISLASRFIFQLLMSLPLLLGIISSDVRQLAAQSRSVESDLERLMIRYEELVLKAYQEKQALGSNAAARVEIAAFDSVISAYAERVLEIYETLHRMKGLTLENHRKAAARVLIFRALAYVENGNLSPAKMRRACKDYQRALLLTRDSKIPIVSQQLPYEVWIGDRLFTRLADLLDEKDKNRILLGCMRQLRKQETKSE